MKFENVSVLVESILEVLKEVRYCWLVSYNRGPVVRRLISVNPG